MPDHLSQNLIGSDLGFARGILLLDDCQGTFNWTVVATGGDDLHDYHSSAAFRGTNGMRLRTRATAPDVADFVDVRRYLGYPESGRAVLRVKTCLPDVSVVDYINWGLDVQNGADRYTCAVLLYPNTPDLVYQNFDGMPESVPELALPIQDRSWLTFEMAVDFAGLAWIEIALGGIRVDLGGAGIFRQGGDGTRTLMATIGVGTIGAATCTLYADDIYVGEIVDL